MLTDIWINNENNAYELDVGMHKGHASYAHSKQVEMSLDVTRCLSKSREEYANVMYIHDVIIQGTQ